MAERVSERTGSQAEAGAAAEGFPQSAPLPARRVSRVRRWLLYATRNLMTALLSLLLAVSIWVAAVIEANPPRDDFYPSEIPIEIRNKPPSLILFQPFERGARVRLRATQTSWDRLQSGDRTQNASAYIDLANATAGLAEYEVHVGFADSDIAILSIEPQNVSLRLEEFKQKSFPVQVSVADTPPIGFLVGTPQSDPSSVQVTGAQSRVDQVAEIVALVQLRGAKAALEREVQLLARDAQGNTVAGVRVAPETAMVRVPVEQRLGFKDVSVKVVTKGTVASGYWLSNISVEPSTLTLVGSPARLDELGGFVSTEPIDVVNARTSFLSRTNLVLPEGVTPVTTQSVLVTIDVAAITGGQTINRQVALRGLDRGLQATVSPETVDLIVSGPLPLLQSLKVEDVQVVIDLAGKAPGKYKITPTVIKPDALRVESLVPDSVEVTISR